MPIYRTFAGFEFPTLGAGFRTAIGRTAGPDAVILEKSYITPIRFSECECHLRIIEDESSLRQELEIHFSASFKSLGDGGSFGAAIDYFHRTKTTAYSLWLVGKIDCRFGGDQMERYYLSPQAWEDLKRYGREGFYNRYGDSFISEIRYGGQFTAIFCVQCNSQNEFEQLKVSVSGKFGGFSSSIELSNTIESVAKKSQLDFMCFSSGFKGEIPEIDFNDRAASTAALVDFIRHFPTKVGQDTIHISHFGTKPYAEAVGWPLKMPSDITRALFHLKKLSLIRARSDRLESALVGILTNPSLYQPFDKKAKQVELATVREFQLNIDRLAEIITLAPWSPGSAPALEFDWDVYENGMPKTMEMPIQPSIRVNWVDQNGGAHSETINMSMEPSVAAFYGWCGDPDNQVLLMTSLSMEFDPPVPGLEIEYFVRFADHNDVGWCQHGAIAASNNSYIWAIGVRLAGQLSRYFMLHYMVRFHGSQSVPFTSPIVAYNNRDMIHGFFLLCQNRITGSQANWTANLPDGKIGVTRALEWRSSDENEKEFLRSIEGDEFGAKQLVTSTLDDIIPDATGESNEDEAS